MMLGYHDVNSGETFLQWIDEQLAQLDSDDQTQPEINDARYADMYGLAEHFAARLALHEALEALGAAPPGFAGPDRQTYLSGIRQLMRGKLLRIKRLLAPAPAQTPGDVALDDATMAAARGMHAHLQSLASLNTAIQGWQIWPPNTEQLMAVRQPPGQPIVLNGPGENITVLGKQKPALTDPQYNVIQALLDAGSHGLNKDELPQKSGHGDAVRILRRVADIDADWKAVIGIAGKRGGRYRILGLN